MVKKPLTAAKMPPNLNPVVLAQLLVVLDIPEPTQPHDPLVHAVMYELSRRKIICLVGEPWLTTLPLGNHYSPKLAYLLNEYIRLGGARGISVDIQGASNQLLPPEVLCKLGHFRRHSLRHLRRKYTR